MSHFGFATILACLPILIVGVAVLRPYGLLNLPRFGDQFRPEALSVVRQYAPPVKPGDIGYDGQFYAQIAVVPTLRDPQLKKACDNPSYRAQRIGLPLIAYVLGGGNPWLILNCYSLLNLAFWFVLLGIFWRHVVAKNARSRLLAIGILWNAGVLISVGRALTDLPALVLSVLSVIWFVREEQDPRKEVVGSKFWAMCVGSYAVLTKETALLSVPAMWSGRSKGSFKSFVLTLVCWGIVILPGLLWAIYIRSLWGHEGGPMENFAFPIYGFVQKIVLSWIEATQSFPRLPLLEMIAPLSIMVQVVYMIRHAKISDVWWRFGIGFAVLAICIGPAVWATQSAYSRVLLPLSFSFNICLFRAKKAEDSHRWWWWFGNAGLLDRAIPGLILLALVALSDAFLKNRACSIGPVKE